MKFILTIVLLLSSGGLIAQDNPCESDVYQRYRDVPNSKLNSAKRHQKRRAEKKCHEYLLDTQGNWALVKSVVIVDQANSMYLDGEKLGKEAGKQTSGGFVPGFMIGVLVSGLSFAAAVKMESGIPIIVSPLSSALVSGLLLDSNSKIPWETIDLYDERSPEFLSGFKTSFSDSSNSRYKGKAVLGSVVGSVLVGGAVFGFIVWAISGSY